MRRGEISPPCSTPETALFGGSFLLEDLQGLSVAWGHGPESNVEVTGFYTVRKGRAFYIEFIWDHTEALETLGLSE